MEDKVEMQYIVLKFSKFVSYYKHAKNANCGAKNKANILFFLYPSLVNLMTCIINYHANFRSFMFFEIFEAL